MATAVVHRGADLFTTIPLDDDDDDDNDRRARMSTKSTSIVIPMPHMDNGVQRRTTYLRADGAAASDQSDDSFGDERAGSGAMQTSIGLSSSTSQLTLSSSSNDIVAPPPHWSSNAARVVALLLAWYICSSLSNNFAKAVLTQLSFPVNMGF
jgi:hypothetical protein